jgi:murein DD-endopeptidase MepM/ murein hydrolase activator NlpD
MDAKNIIKIGLLSAILICPEYDSLSGSPLEKPAEISNYFYKSAKDSKVEILNSIPNGLPIDPLLIKRDIRKLSGFGMRLHPILRTARMHKGVDFPAKKGVQILATSYGVVKRVAKSPTYGNVIEIQSGEYTIRYAHCNEIFINEGDHVKSGELIASVGSTGLSTGAHLHYEIIENGKNVNPKEFF